MNILVSWSRVDSPRRRVIVHGIVGTITIASRLYCTPQFQCKKTSQDYYNAVAVRTTLIQIQYVEPSLNSVSNRRNKVSQTRTTPSVSPCDTLIA